MSIFDVFKGIQYKKELEKANNEIIEMKKLFTPEMQDADNLRRAIESLTIEKNELNETLTETQKKIDDANESLKIKRQQLVTLDEEILMQDFGLYKPRFDFATSAQYKDKLDEIREKQKAMIKAGKAVNGNTNWTVNNNAAKGQKMVKDTQKLLLRAFNSDCDEAISKFK